jgi:iron complex outermembrane recepter protein
MRTKSTLILWDLAWRLAVLVLFVWPSPVWAQPAPTKSKTSRPAPQKRAMPKIVGETVVTASRVETEVRNLPASVTRIGRRRLQRPGTKSAVSALSDTAGIAFHGRQENATFFGLEIRGLSTNSTSGGNLLILLDGIPQRRLSFSGPYIGALPYDAVTSMELVKGPISSLFGRNALAGALQLFSDPGGPEPRFESLIYYEYPTHTARAALKYSGPILKGEPYSLSITSSFGYAHGWQPENQSKRGDLYFHLSFPVTSRDLLTVLGGFYQASEEYVAPVFLDADGKRLPGISRRENLAVPGQNALALTELRAALRWRRHWTRWLTSKATVSYWHGDSFWKVGRPSDQPANGTVVARSASDRQFVENVLFSELEVSASFKAGKWLRGAAVVGASYEYLRYDMTVVEISTAEALAANGNLRQGIPLDLANPVEPPRSEWVLGDKTRRDTFEHNGGAFARLQATLLGKLHLQAGIRYDTYRRTQRAPATGERAELTGGAWSPGVGLNVTILERPRHRLNMYVQYGMGFSPVFRAVNNTMFAEVKPERSEGIEGGFKWSLWKRQFSGELVFYRLDRKKIVAMNPQSLVQENIGDWRIEGLELSAKTRPLRRWLIYATYALRDARILHMPGYTHLERNRIPAVAKHTVTAGTRVRLPKGFAVGVALRYVSEAFGNEDNSFRIPGYVLLDAWVGWRYKRWLRVAIFGKNLLDQDYYSAVFNRVAVGSAFAGTPLTVGVSANVKF